MTEIIDGKKYEAIEDMMGKAISTGAQIVTGGSVANIFTITGGPIEVVALVGEVTAAVSAHACAMKLIMDPTAGADTDMCATIDINGFVINSWIFLDGTIASAAVQAIPGTTLPLGIGMDIPLILPPGTIDMNLANNNPTTGAITWYLRYKPLVTGITVIGKA